MSIINVTNQPGKTVPLDAGASTQVLLLLNASDLLPSTSNVTVSADDDSGSASLAVTS